MNIQNPATPVVPAGTPATPGSASDVITTPPTPTTPVVPEGKVTLSTKEFAQLTRDAARGRSAQRRNELNGRKNLPGTVDLGNPDVNQVVTEAQQRAAEAERKALQLEVKDRVRDLLDKDEFKSLPKSTRELILKNPASLSEADDLEEAMLDIEDFVREQVIPLDLNLPAAGNPAPGATPPGVTTPPVINNSTPAPAVAVELEDLSKLTGSARSTAAIRNSIKKARGLVK